MDTFLIALECAGVVIAVIGLRREHQLRQRRR